MADRVAFALAATLLVTSVVELISAVGLVAVESRSPGTVRQLFLHNHLEGISEALRRRYAADSYDPVLGWTLKPGRTLVAGAPADRWTLHVAADGRRAGPGSEGAAYIATYGDSFMTGDEVEDDETWQSRLALEIERPIANYGVSGTGPYQALLRFERHLEQGRVSPVTVLGIMEDGLARARNRYRPYFLPHTSIPLGFKPSLDLVEGQVVERPLTWDGQGDLAAAAEEAAHGDVWAERMISFTPPFTLRVWSTFEMRHQTDAVRALWSEPDVAVLAWVIDRFVEQAEAAGSVPIVLWVPKGPTVQEGLVPAYRPLADRLDVRQIDAVEVTDAPGLWQRPYMGHWSPRGHRAVARHVWRHLGEQGLR